MRSTKKEMFDLIKELQKERNKQEEVKLNPEKIKEETKKEAIVQKADEKAESDLAGEIHSLKVAIGKELTTLSDKIEAEAEKYLNIKEAIALKESELEEIYGVEKAASELAVILEAQRAAIEDFETENAKKKAQLSEELDGKREKVEGEIAATKTAWQKENEEYDYETARTRQIEKNKFADELAALKKEIAVKKEVFAKEQEQKTTELEEREKAVSQRETIMTDFQAKVDQSGEKHEPWKQMQLSLTKKPSASDCSCDSSHPILSQTFSHTSNKLPTIAQIKSHIYTDRQWMEIGDFSREKQLLTMKVRDSYIRQSFVLLTDEFIRSLKRLCTDFTSIIELGAGIGWLGHWLCKYGIRVQASVDNKTWPGFPPDRYLEIVQQIDSVDYMRLHPEVELFILSWPEEDDLASQIWHGLRPGQHLLYIGEDRGGCTANNDFFELIQGHEVVNNATRKMRQSFLSFDDFHDQPHLYKKG